MKRKRKIRTFTIPDDAYVPFKRNSRNMSKDIERMIRRFNKACGP